MADISDVQGRKFERIVKLSTEGIWTVDSDGLTDFINEQGAAMLGHRPEEIIGRPVTDFVHPEDRGMLDKMPEMIKRGNSESLEVRMPRKDGSEVWLLVSTSAMIGDDGRFHGALSTATDITVRKRMEEQLKESEERYRLLIQYAPTGIYEIDFRIPRFTSVNDVMCEKTGYPRNELLSMSPTDLMDEESKRTFAERAKKALSGERFDEPTDYTIACKNGRRMDVTLNALLRYENGRPMGAFVIAHDVTERKRYEEEIKRSNAELQQFAFVASHDLQEPLRMVSLYLELLDSRFGEGLSAQALEYLSTAIEGAYRMRQLIDDLLLYSRIESQPCVLAPVDMNEVLDVVIAEMRVTITESEAELIVHPLPTVHADQIQMKQLMGNLISNAIKFHGDDRPRIEVSAVRGSDAFVLSVKDNGIGIDPRYRDKIFQMFQRLHTKDEYPGTGIGLAIARKIVERHGGRIWFKSRVGAGTTFSFSIPLVGKGEAVRVH